MSSAIGTNPDLTVRLIHGTGDDVIPLERSSEFEAALAEPGYDVELITVDCSHVEPPAELFLATVLEMLGR